ncbi:MAG: 2-phospho-L-lactate transferase [Candidatus Methanomethylicia archaeon]
MSKITALAGGVGAARFLDGLVRITDPSSITVIVNVGDDVEIYGLYISPDIDTIIYTLAGIADDVKGWGIRGDTFNCLEMLSRYGFETWFRIGDKDLATHIFRTMLLRRGLKLQEVIDIIRRRLNVKVKVIPATNDRIETMVLTDKGFMSFQDYFVKRGFQDEVKDIIYRGIEKAEPANGVIEAIMNADGVIICPSNPIVSIGTIVSIKGVRKALRETKAKIIGVSPIISGTAVKGPADKMLKGLGLEPSAYSVAELYRDFLDVFVIDKVDINLKDKIEKLGITVYATNTLMKNLEDRIRIAREVLSLIIE